MQRLFSTARLLARNEQWRKPFRPGNTPNKFSRGRNQRGPRREDDSWLVQRNQRHKARDDGLMGMDNYTIDKESIKTLTNEELIPENPSEPPTGMSPIPTSILADRRLVARPLVNSLLHNRHYEWMTPVQAQTILPILRNESVVVRAKTGTGKTAAFIIPSVQKVLENRVHDKVSVIVVSPTRELAQQIADEAFQITQWGGLSDIKVQSMVGGVSRVQQLREFARGGAPDIVVATPGRLLDILDEPGILEKFSDLQFRVFDEADRLLDIGFEGILREIREKLEEVTGPDVPLLLFSATADNSVRRFARDQFGDRVRVVDTVPANEPTANELVDQTAVATANWRDTFEAAASTIVAEAAADPAKFKAVVFLPTVALVDKFEHILKALLPRGATRQNTAAIHGQRTQASRQRRADAFRKSPTGILITTDVVARGMDFPLVSHVYQLGTPPDVSSYVHRIGRTARAGNSGKSVLWYTNHVRKYIDALGREGITPKREVWKPDLEFRERFEDVAVDAVTGEDETQELANSLLSYMAVLKSKYHVDARQFVNDMTPFVSMFGADRLEMSRANRGTWESTPKRRPGYGSSRKSRFRW